LKSAGLNITSTKIAEMKRTAKSLGRNEYEIKVVVNIWVGEANGIGRASKFHKKVISQECPKYYSQ
jgi:hypothetical protein